MPIEFARSVVTRTHARADPMPWIALPLVALLAAWLAAVLQHPLPRPLAQALLAAAVAALSAWCVRALRSARAAAAAEGRPRWALPATLAIVALALVLRFAGLDHEIRERYYLDEGTYLQHATKINAGEPIRDSFVYPHLLYNAGAFAIWVASLVEAPLTAVVARLWPDVADWANLCRFALRAVVALLGALVVLPVIALGRRIAGRQAGSLAGLLGGLLIALSPLWDEGAHLGICDLPSAFFATLALAACGRWLDESRPRVWIAAGAAAGFAAGAKYPAGLVALAIVALWVRDLGATPRRWRSLPIAAAAALVAFLLTTPSLLFLPGAAFLGDHSVFFGAVQYQSSGWLGVAPESRLAWYGARLAESFGWPALALGALGLVLVSSELSRETARRLAWLAPFPLLYLALLVYLPVAVERNLYPALPALAVGLGVGLAGLAVRASARSGPWVTGAALAATLAWPATQSVAQAISYVRPSTRDLAVGWLHRELPRGLTLMTENYGPNLPRPEFVVRRPPGRFAAMLSIEEAASWGVDAVVLAAPSWSRFFEPGVDLDEGERSLRDAYARWRTETELLAQFDPGRLRRGPALEVRALPVALRRLALPATIPAGELVVPDSRMRIDDAAVAQVDGEWVAAVLPLEAGSYRLRWEGERNGGEPRVATLRKSAATIAADGDGARLALPADDTAVVYLTLGAGGEVRSLSVERASDGANGAPPR